MSPAAHSSGLRIWRQALHWKLCGHIAASLTAFSQLVRSRAMVRADQITVLAAGLHRLGGQCERISGELAAAAASPVTGVSSWQCNAAAVHVAAAAAGKDLGAIAGRVGNRGGHYHTAASAYTSMDEEGAQRFRALVP